MSTTVRAAPTSDSLTTSLVSARASGSDGIAWPGVVGPGFAGVVVPGTKADGVSLSADDCELELIAYPTTAAMSSTMTSAMTPAMMAPRREGAAAPPGTVSTGRGQP